VNEVASPHEAPPTSPRWDRAHPGSVNADPTRVGSRRDAAARYFPRTARTAFAAEAKTPAIWLSARQEKATRISRLPSAIVPTP